MDEVGETTPRMQGLLLRFLETGEIQRVGSDQVQNRVDVRVIAATNRNLLENVSAKTFREDLYYRLNVIHLRVPPLRERKEDVPLLLNHFMETFARQYGVEMPRISGAALETLVEHPWPGNVRELKNVVERIVIRHQSGEVDRADLPLEVLRSVPTTTQAVVAAAPKVARQVSEALFDQMVSGRQSFWSVVYAPFISRDLTREDLRAIVRKGLEQTSGNYRVLVELFNMPQDDYKRFLGFLRKYQCHVPFQEFRSAAVSRGGPRGGGDRAAEERSPDRIAASI
jgi:DNA-binding NtrC family response regulator